jgi:hypothetical protein
MSSELKDGIKKILNLFYSKVTTVTVHVFENNDVDDDGNNNNNNNNNNNINSRPSFRFWVSSCLVMLLIFVSCLILIVLSLLLKNKLLKE